MKLTKLLSLSAALVLIGFSQMHSAQAFYCSNCATRFQQLHQYAKELEISLNTARQLETQVHQYQDMLKQGMALPDNMFKSVTNDLQNVSNVYKNTQSIGRNVSNLDQQFRQQFPGYDEYLKTVDPTQPSVPDLYKRWSQEGLDNARTAMEATDANTSSFKAEDSALSGLITQSQSAAGRMQAIQAGNQIAAQNVQQIQKLRDLVATQITMQSNYLAQQQERQSQDDAFMQKFMSGKQSERGRHDGF